MRLGKKLIFILIIVLASGYGAQSLSAQTGAGLSYIPLIGLTAVPDPLALPAVGGRVTYHYAVKNFIAEIPLTNLQVVDDGCGPVEFITGDDNGDTWLDYGETWRYSCLAWLATTTQSTATVRGVANGISATHKAYATVIVGSDNPPPLVSIVNISKVAYPLSLPAEGGDITFTYKVNNPGVAPLSNVMVSDDKCRMLSGKLGDKNGNNLLDTSEVWIYTCVANLKQTTTNTVQVTAFANGRQAVSEATITVHVDQTSDSPVPLLPNFPETGGSSLFKIMVWTLLSGLGAALMVFFFLARSNRKL